MGLAPAAQLQDADVAEVAIALRKIQAVADHEFVGDLKTDVVRPDLLDPRRSFTQQRSHVQRAWIALQKNPLKIGQGAAGIQDVFDEDRVQAFDAVVQILGQPDLPRTAAELPITGYRDEIERDFEINLPDQIGEKNRCAFKNTDEVQALAAKVGSDLAA